MKQSESRRSTSAKILQGMLSALTFIIVGMMLFGCASTPPSGDSADRARQSAAGALSGKTAEQTKSETGEPPAWIDDYPTDNAYYIGVGSADSGSKSADMEAGRAKALQSLAAAIRVEIQAESTIVERADSEGNRYDAAENTIKESVDQNLTLVEVVDSYWSEELGYWFYVRIDKAAWFEIQRREKADLNSRVLNLVEPVLESPAATMANKLTVLAKAWDLVMASPYAGTVDSELLGKSGKLIDLVERNIAGAVNTALITVDPKVVSVEVGRPAAMTINVQTGGSPQGQLYVNLIYKANGETFTQLATDQDGLFEGNVDTVGMQPGKISITALLDVESFGINPDEIRTSLLIPARDVTFDVQQVKAGLRVNVPEGVNSGDFYSRVEALLAKKLPFKIGRPGSDDRFVLGFALQFTDYPENTYGLLITEARAIITVEKEGRTLYSVETKNIKGGGLNRGQAYDKSIEALMEYIDEESGIANEMSAVLSYE